MRALAGRGLLHDLTPAKPNVAIQDLTPAILAAP